MKPLILVALLTLAACAETSLMSDKDIPMLQYRQNLPPSAFGQLTRSIHEAEDCGAPNVQWPDGVPTCV